MKTTVTATAIADSLVALIADVQQLAYETGGHVDYADEIHTALNQFRDHETGHHSKLVDNISDYVTRVFEIQERLQEDM